MLSFPYLSARPLPKRRPPPVSLRLEELEPRTTPTVSVVPQQFTTTQYTALSISQDQLLAGDSGTVPLSVSNATQPANATLADNHNGTFTFTPNPSFSGSTTFQYSVGIPQGELPASANFGATISISGDTAVIGAPGQASSSAHGEAYVFVRSGSTWTQQTILTAADGSGGDLFGTAVAVDGDTAVIGAPGTLSAQGGTAYVFVRSGSTWTQQAKLTGDNGNPFNVFNQSMAISGDTAVIGASQQTTGLGDAYVFVRSGNAWSKQAVLSTGGNHGVDVSISGDTVVLGQGAQEAAHVYVRSGTTWTQQALLTANDGAANDNFGSSVSVSGDTIVVEALQHTVNGSLNQGAAYVFVRSGSTWTQQAELTANDGSAGSFFGFAVEVSGDTAGVEASFEPFSPSSSNAVSYVFVRSGSAWSQQAKLSPADGYDSGLALSGGTVLLGAPAQGTASVFVPSGSAWSQQAELIPQDLAEATATVQVNPAAAQLIVSPTTLPTVTEGQVYPSTTFTATGGAGSGYTFQESGILPKGLTFDATIGQLTGTPTQAGTFPGIVIAASDGHGGSGSQTYTLTVNTLVVNGLPVPYPPTIYAPPTSKSEPDADNRAFIRGLYHSVLNRDVENAAALNYWETVINIVQTTPQQLGLAAGTDPYQYLAKSFWESQEHRWSEVESYYHTFLGRDLDPNNAYNLSERQYWTNQFLVNGAQEADVVRGFLTSPEYLFNHRADTSLTNVLNTDLLAGTATAAHLADWNGRLASLDAQRAALQHQTFATPDAYKAPLAGLLGNFDNEPAKTGVLFDALNADEYAQRTLSSFYLAFLQRAGTALEKQGLLALRDASGNPLALGTIAELMLASHEYRQNAVNSEV